MHEAMTGKARANGKALYRAPAENRVSIWGDLVQTCPMRSAARPFEQRHALDRCFEILQLELFIHILVEAGLFIWITHPDQQPIALAVEIERLRKIDHEWKIFGDFLQRVCGEHLSPDGDDRHLDSRHLTNPPGPGSGRVQDEARLDHA